ncbi:MAG: hypothetical protein V4719_10190 [Planctomycetota bacterium]
MKLTPELEARLRELAAKSAAERTQEGQRQICLEMNDATRGLEIHPDWWCNSCCCDVCLSYGDY